MKDKELRKFLLKIGISSHLQGFHYIINGVKLVEKQKIHTNITTVYEFISKEHDTTPSKAERAIRHAIKQSYKNSEILKSIYASIPDNSAFLYDLVFNFDILSDLTGD